MRRTCNPEKPVRVWHGAPSGKSSAWFEHSIDNREAAGSTPASRTMFSCGQVNRCHAGLISHASGVQLASPQPDFGGVDQREDCWPATSWPRTETTTADLIRGQGDQCVRLWSRGSIPSSSSNSPGRPLRSRRRSESRTSTFDSCSWHQL